MHVLQNRNVILGKRQIRNDIPGVFQNQRRAEKTHAVYFKTNDERKRHTPCLFKTPSAPAGHATRLRDVQSLPKSLDGARASPWATARPRATIKAMDEPYTSSMDVYEHLIKPYKNFIRAL